VLSYDFSSDSHAFHVIFDAFVNLLIVQLA
jgi:hypothetical protein